MTREPYRKPEVKSENLEPEALSGAGSHIGEAPTNYFVADNGYDSCLSTIRRWLS